MTLDVTPSVTLTETPTTTLDPALTPTTTATDNPFPPEPPLTPLVMAL
jgi:hypothetical protein